jgi:hypothetical protein
MSRWSGCNVPREQSVTRTTAIHWPLRVRRTFWVGVALSTCVVVFGVWRYRDDREKTELVQRQLARELTDRGLALPDAATRTHGGPGDYPGWYGPQQEHAPQPTGPAGPYDDTRTGKPCSCIPGDPLCWCR